MCFCRRVCFHFDFGVNFSFGFGLNFDFDFDFEFGVTFDFVFSDVNDFNLKRRFDQCRWSVDLEFDLPVVWFLMPQGALRDAGVVDAVVGQWVSVPRQRVHTH